MNEYSLSCCWTYRPLWKSFSMVLESNWRSIPDDPSCVATVPRLWKTSFNRYQSTHGSNHFQSTVSFWGICITLSRKRFISQKSHILAPVSVAFVFYLNNLLKTTIELPVICDALTHVWRHCNVMHSPDLNISCIRHPIPCYVGTWYNVPWL